LIYVDNRWNLRKYKDRERYGRFKRKQLPLHECDKQLEEISITIYACEGYKTGKALVGVSNSNPSIIKTFFDYLVAIGVPTSETKIRIIAHDDLDFNIVRAFWTNMFPEVRYKGERRRQTKSKRNKLKYGVAHLEVCSTQLWEYIMEKVLKMFPSG